MGTTPTSGASFTGSSAFSAQLANVVTRAVSMASAPLNQLQSQQTTVTNQQKELEALLTDFQSLQTALDSIDSASGLGSFAATVDNESVATASISSGVMAGTYAINVTSIGARTSTISADGLTTVTDPSAGNIDASSSYTLTVNGQAYAITDSTGSLNGLAQAINASGANVQATVINVGSSSSPDYRLSVQSLNYAPDSVQLDDGTNSLLNTLTTGSYVSYQVNGQPSTPINSNSRSVTLSPGLSVNILQTGTATIDVAQDTGAIADKLTSLVNAYNATVDELAKNRGQNGGALSGQSVIFELQSALRNIVGYGAPSGTITSLAQLGVSFNQSGHLQFDQSAFDEAAPSDVLAFFGSESSGGFLQAASNVLNSVTDPINGLLPEADQAATQRLSTLASQ
ncbi:MAG TPA: flagellar filament capping protein FliD, partial [Candidatus Binataceae bacterium]|nr:flagellar filament capping protein FliD [Candidatus Binataceae bacterium]